MKKSEKNLEKEENKKNMGKKIKEKPRKNRKSNLN